MTAVESIELPRPFIRLAGRAFKGFVRPRFRGEIYDYARSIWLGNGYEVPPSNLCRNCRAKDISACRHFEIDTARQLIGPFKALRDPNVPLVMQQKAAQTLGSLVWDLWAHYLLVHTDYTRIIIFLENDQKAKLYCDSRLMPTLKANPDISPFLPSGADRFDDKKTDIILTNGKMIRVCGLNETNASSLTWQVVIIDEGWQHGRDGLQQKAMDRNKQVANKKTFIVGQAGKAKEDQDMVWQRVRQVPVTWACPCCLGRQQFGAHGPSLERPSAGFVPREIVNTEFISGQGPDKLPLLPPVQLPGTYAGLQVTKSFSEIKSSSEIMAVAATAFLECYFCGSQLPDTTALRWRLMKSYEQDYLTGADGVKNDFVPAGTEIGFWMPEPCSITIPFRDTMKEYIVAKKAQSERGHFTALETFYMSRWAMAWDENMLRSLRAARRDDYDVGMAQHDAWRLCMIVDNQLDLMTQWVMVLAVKQDGDMRQLWRGALHGLAECRKKQLEYLDAKGKPLIKDQFVFLDGRYKPENICRHIVEFKYGHWTNYHGERTWLAWNLMQGSPYEYQTHAEEKDKTKKFVVGDPNWREYQVDGGYVEVLIYPFSATACGIRFEASRDGQGSETLFLDRLADEPPDDHELSHHSQIHSNKLVESNAYAPRAAKMRYVPVPASAPDHYFHMWRMAEAVKEIWQIDGVFSETMPVAMAAADAGH